MGKRIANIRHAFNLREGLNPIRFEVPGRIIGDPPQTAGNVRGVNGSGTRPRGSCWARPSSPCRYREHSAPAHCSSSVRRCLSCALTDR